MKYTVRIYFLTISLLISILEYILGFDTQYLEILFNILISCISWFIGWIIDKIIFYSEKDYLTDVYNRRFFDRVVDKMIKKEKYRGRKLTLFILDVNNFKYLNDTFGHMVGDSALKDISKLLKNNIKNTDILARWGGDEFIIISPNTDREDAELFKKNIISEFHKKINYREHGLGISIGFSIFPEEAMTIDKLLNIADTKMYDMKIPKKV